ncbi:MULTISPECIES: peptide deformylase [Atopobiaceae]|uniref:Peptide deformylase n=1 Tax=Parafannyhessea umbonata TaxID=604330 RepID=A0A1H6K7X3_9ACTN|nr:MULTISPECIES: peptide deformylase [Atopobiaceae]SEH67887.1 peptide deformylase [Parafannyhessea umbonata]SJZ88158.1 peptide deformylase [Olsenella sp. KH1P3]
MSAEKDIVCAPDDRLKTECAPIQKIDDGVKALAKRMLEDMYESDGCGLAAPQVGELVQLVVIDVDYSGAHDRNPYVLINPKIVKADGPERPFNEGCLSYPGISVEVSRPSHVVVQALDLEGDLMQYEAQDNLLAVCLQHEIDHLHGITMVDHLTPGQRVAAMRDYQQAVAAGARPGETSVD